MNTKTCLNCGEKFERPAYMSVARFKRMLYCTRGCGYALRLDRAMKKEKYAIEQEPKVEYGVISNIQYNHDMSEVEGLSRLYLDNKINLDTLRVMELKMKGVTL